MCECGCVGNDNKYLFPGPGNTHYVLTLHGGCIECESPSGFTIERVDSTNVLWEEFNRGEFLTGNLAFAKWPDSVGVAFITGMLRPEFIEATKSHLIGIDSKDFANDADKRSRDIDEYGAEAILEEMYEDAQTKPRLVEPSDGTI
jgi:hypothetical protein